MRRPQMPVASAIRPSCGMPRGPSFRSSLRADLVMSSASIAVHTVNSWAVGRAADYTRKRHCNPQSAHLRLGDKNKVLSWTIWRALAAEFHGRAGLSGSQSVDRALGLLSR
jgi:hypothetical protein